MCDYNYSNCGFFSGELWFFSSFGACFRKFLCFLFLLFSFSFSIFLCAYSAIKVGVFFSPNILLLDHIEYIFSFIYADKDRELGEALAEVKSLKTSERLKEKAVEEVLFLVLYHLL